MGQHYPEEEDSPAYACMVESMDENTKSFANTPSSELEKDTLVIFFPIMAGFYRSSPNMPTSGLPLRRKSLAL